MAECTGVILAAGYGRRMGGLGIAFPKTLLPVGDRAILNHHIQLLVDLGVSDIVVVVGHQADQIAAVVAEHTRPDVQIRQVLQQEPLGSAHALSLVRPFVKDGVIALLGDYYFRASDAAAVRRRLEQGACAIALKHEPETRLIAEACAVTLDDQGRVIEIVEKPMRPATSLKGCGMYACTAEFFDAVARTPRTALRNEYELTTALELHVKSGRPLFGEAIVQWDANLTRPTDLLECNLRWLEDMRRASFTAPDARVAPDAVLASTVVGARASVGRGARISESVVFPAATVRPGTTVQRAIVTPNGVVQC